METRRRFYAVHDEDGAASKAGSTMKRQELIDRMKCMVGLHDFTRVSTEKILFGVKKERHCKRIKCMAQEVTYV